MEAAGLCVRTDGPAHLPAASMLTVGVAGVHRHVGLWKLRLTQQRTLFTFVQLIYVILQQNVTSRLISEGSPYPRFSSLILLKPANSTNVQYNCVDVVCVCVYFSACKMLQLFQMLRDNFSCVYDFWIIGYMLKWYFQFCAFFPLLFNMQFLWVSIFVALTLETSVWISSCLCFILWIIKVQ